jgi:hypothetical protein
MGRIARQFECLPRSPVVAKPAETTERDEIVRLLKALDGYFLCGGICNSEFV